MAKFSMKTFFDNWAHAYRNWEAFGTAFFLVVILVWGWYMTRGFSVDQLVEVRYISAKVIDISPSDRTSNNSSPIIGMIALEDGRKVRLLFMTPIPEIGDSVPLRVEYFENGETFYSLDAERWRMGVF